MNYSSGERIQIGDNVLIENGRTPGIVEQIIESEKDLEVWNVEEKGVLVLSKPFGAVFWPIGEKDDPAIFVSRRST